MFVSYAQNYEDVMLWRALGHVPDGFYIDIGACDPVELSVTKAFYDRGWRGINIEPNPEYLEKLKRDRPGDTNIGYAVAERDGEADLFVVEGTGLSTLDSGIAQGHRDRAFEQQQVRTPVRTLGRIWRETVPPARTVHFLKIDVEGLESAVIAGGDWHDQRPWIVVVEATVPMSQEQNHETWEPTLLEAGYLFAWFDGINRFYVAQERSDLLAAFEAPPNFFDGMKLAALQEVEAALRDKHEALHEKHEALHQATRMSARLETDLQRAEANMRDMEQRLAITNEALNQERGMREMLMQRETALHDRLSVFLDGAMARRRAWWESAVFHTSGKPRGIFRRLFFHSNGKTRGMMRSMIVHSDGRPRGPFRAWMESPRYQELPRAMPIPVSGTSGQIPGVVHTPSAPPIPADLSRRQKQMETMLRDAMGRSRSAKNGRGR